MAERKFSPFPVLKQPKLPVYRALYNMGLDFESIAKQIKILNRSNDKALPRETLRLVQVQAESLRSGVCHLLTGILHRRESVDWCHYGRLADELEKRQMKVRKLRK